MGIPGVGGSNRADLAGRRFGRLLVLKLWSRGTRTERARWLCVCDCGNEKDIPANSLTSGRSNSCGCLSAEITSKRCRTHGMGKTTIYRSWASMRSRCLNANNSDYKCYGGRGIKVCARWSSFENFRKDMGDKPAGTEIDRIDNNGNYEPGNCRWVSHKENSRNTRKCRYVTFGGETLPINAWAERIGISEGTIRSRLNRGRSVLEALSTKRRLPNKCSKTAPASTPHA